MHLSQVASGSPPSQHSQEGQHTGQEGDRRIAEQGAREGQHHTGQACCGPRRDETTPQRLDIALKNLGLDELGELFGLEIDDDDVDTAGGLLTKAIGRVPLPGAHGSAQGVDLTAEEAVGRRRQVATLIVSRTPGPDLIGARA